MKTKQALNFELQTLDLELQPLERKAKTMKKHDVAAAIFTDGAKIMIARRACVRLYPGRWEFPGGKIQADESADQCLVREIREEFDVDIDECTFFTKSSWVYPEREIHLQAFLVPKPDIPFTLKVHDALEWVLPENLHTYDLLEADRVILADLVQHFASK